MESLNMPWATATASCLQLKNCQEPVFLAKPVFEAYVIHVPVVLKGLFLWGPQRRVSVCNKLR